MANLSTKYLGLNLKNPIVAASSGLTNSIEDIKALEDAGIGAIVLKSVFEEEILEELQRNVEEAQRPATIYPEIYDYFDFSNSEDTISKYLHLIESAKKTVKVPIIASVNCVSAEEWPLFARIIESSGADALELNVFVMPSDFKRSGLDNEKVYFDVIENVMSEVSIPISLKVSYYFSNLARMLKKLSETGIAGLTLFNRFFNPDIDIDNMKVIPTNIYSSPKEITTSLRWIAMMANRVHCDLAASTGIHDGRAVIKQLLAGAKVTQIASTMYKNGFGVVGSMLSELEDWMDTNEYVKLDDFRGKMSQANTFDPAAFERAQFMKHFSGKVLQ